MHPSMHPKTRFEGFSLPAYTERGEQYDTFHGQEDGHFLTRWGSYNSLVVEVRGVEPLSENNSTGLSPGAGGHSERLTPPCSPSGWQAATPTGRVRVIMHGTVNSFRTHVHR